MEACGRMSPTLPKRMLPATAVPVTGQDPLNTTSTFLDSVAGQGGGAIRAWNAPRVSTIVEPAGLAFNDTEHRHASPLRLADNNTGAAEVVYKLANLPAVACNLVEKT
ncbi:hypothetical protein J3459_011904 [Metarhizium acridum]|nr:hypothetical protein J3459_011904 [Metarhizium acridum]